eukprot:TRINITY_DN100413_c0_g1_i1.p1 TRINITY_DN100413_c0_g1~~TRINITY_DN100413_c0_g1_i1.p1  ORF type:complete len:330 (+),score=74.25 TRINITY_DN100413_c0_g1_i1:119-1108(+)
MPQPPMPTDSSSVYDLGEDEQLHLAIQQSLRESGDAPVDGDQLVLPSRDYHDEATREQLMGLTPDRGAGIPVAPEDAWRCEGSGSSMGGGDSGGGGGPGPVMPPPPPSLAAAMPESSTHPREILDPEWAGGGGGRFDAAAGPPIAQFAARQAAAAPPLPRVQGAVSEAPDAAGGGHSISDAPEVSAGGHSLAPPTPGSGAVPYIGSTSNSSSSGSNRGYGVGGSSSPTHGSSGHGLTGATGAGTGFNSVSSSSTRPSAGTAASRRDVELGPLEQAVQSALELATAKQFDKAEQLLARLTSEYPELASAREVSAAWEAVAMCKQFHGSAA